MVNSAAVKQYDDYLFDGVHQALTFAYRYSGQQYSPSVLAQFMARSGGSGKGLSGLDGAAQAGLIRALIDRLPMQERHIIAARFSANECESVGARLALLPVAICCMGTGCHSTRAADALLQKCFGLKLNIHDVADMYGIQRNAVSPAWRNVRERMKQIWERAEEGAFRELQGSGLIP